MTEWMRVLAVLSVLLALAGAWACHRAGKRAPNSPRALAWHALAVLITIRAANTIGLMYAPGWEYAGQVVNAAWMGFLALALAQLGRTFTKGEHENIQRTR
jgi:hypothetical protein